MPKTLLEQIANDMHRQLALREEGQTTRTLSRGLVIVLKKNGRQRTLSLGRKDTKPSTDELITCARAFGVPLGTDPHFDQRGGYHVVDFHWIEEAQPTAHQQPLLSTAPTAY